MELPAMHAAPSSRPIVRTSFVLLTALMCGLTGALARETRSIDFDWRFHLGDITGAEQSDYDDTSWRQLDVPHDWSIEGEYKADNPTGPRGGYLPMGIGWYRKNIDAPAGWIGK